MTEKCASDPAEVEFGEYGNGNSDVNLSQRRLPRSIRFSDSEWKLIERVARERGMAAAELVRHAAVGIATGKLTTTPPDDLPTSLQEISAQTERIYNGVYLLATLKRDEMIQEGRQDELDEIIGDARNSRKILQKNSD